jgi:hypothetical protein
LHSRPEDVPAVHHYYGFAVAISGTIMAVGFCTFLANVILTVTSSTNHAITDRQN